VNVPSKWNPHGIDIERLIEDKKTEIRAGLTVLKHRLEREDYSQLVHWIIPDTLACSPRPLRYHPVYGGSGTSIESSATSLVKEWVDLIEIEGIRSIISLMHLRDIAYYEGLDLGATNLIEFYRNRGFKVEHIPWEDPRHSKATFSQTQKTFRAVRKLALQAYDRLPKPVLVQCSAGVDRTAPVAAYILISRNLSTHSNF
jgi:hypothetical protein